MTISKKDAIQIVKKYFEDAEINPKLRWEDVVKQMAPTAPENAFRILSNGEKRQLWSEFQSKAKKRQREKERQTRHESMNKFNHSVNQWIIKDQSCNRLLRFQDFLLENSQYSWWKHIEDNEKNEMFQEIVEEYERIFLKEVEEKYEENLNTCRYFMNSHPEIFPTLDKKLKFAFAQKIPNLKHLKANKIWQIIHETCIYENFFARIYKNDIINIYIQLLKDRIAVNSNKYKQIITGKLVKYRKIFWEIIKNDILLGNIKPTTKSRKNYFISLDEMKFDVNISIAKILKKRLEYNSAVEKKCVIFEDFLSFFIYHLSIEKDRKIILFLLKQPFKNGKYIYCIEMFSYILNLIQEFKDHVFLLCLKVVKRSETVLSLTRLKEFIKQSTYYVKFKSKLIIPFSFDSIFDELTTNLFLEEVKYESKKNLARNFK